MPTWILIVATIFLIILTLGGLFSFPYVPMFFGVYEGNRKRLQSRIIVWLLQLFPVVAIFSIIAAWIVHPVAIFIPFIHFVVVWFLRENPSIQGDFSKQTTLEQAIKERVKELDYEWNGQEQAGHAAYILFTVSVGDVETLKSLVQKIEDNEKLVQPITINNEVVPVMLEVRVSISDATREGAIDITRCFIESIWPLSALLMSLSIMDE